MFTTDIRQSEAHPHLKPSPDELKTNNNIKEIKQGVYEFNVHLSVFENPFNRHKTHIKGQTTQNVVSWVFFLCFRF